jgi:deoxyribonuclease V
MLAALDVGYRTDGTACAAVVGFLQWDDDSPVTARTVEIGSVAAYQPGKFYLRELPCLLAALSLLDASPRLILIDGFVWLGDQSKPGAGARLYDALGRATPVVGVAKTNFRGCSVAEEIYRGKSLQPLFVTAAGMAAADAARQVQAMHGPHRLPTLLKCVDALSRS